MNNENLKFRDSDKNNLINIRMIWKDVFNAKFLFDVAKITWT